MDQLDAYMWSVCQIDAVRGGMMTVLALLWRQTQSKGGGLAVYAMAGPLQAEADTLGLRGLRQHDLRQRTGGSRVDNRGFADDDLATTWGSDVHKFQIDFLRVRSVSGSSS